MQKIKDKGVLIAEVELKVGLGTFRPVRVDTIEEHEMHSEYYSMTKEVADLLNETKKNGKRVIAVGTTSTRTLETIATKYNVPIFFDEDITGAVSLIQEPTKENYPDRLVEENYITKIM